MVKDVEQTVSGNVDGKENTEALTIFKPSLSFFRVSSKCTSQNTAEFEELRITQDYCWLHQVFASV